MCRRWLSDEHLDALFLFIRLKIKAAGIPSSQNFTTADTIFMVWDSLVTYNRRDDKHITPIRQLVPKLLDSTGFFDRRGRSSTYKEPWPVVIVDPIPLQRNNCDCGVFAIKYFEYIVFVGLDTLCQENMSYFRKQLAFQVWTNQHSYVLKY
ncbi:hypothetical protein IC575_028487 [Cucumis melo]